MFSIVNREFCQIWFFTNGCRCPILHVIKYYIESGPIPKWSTEFQARSWEWDWSCNMKTEICLWNYAERCFLPALQLARQAFDHRQECGAPNRTARSARCAHSQLDVAMSEMLATISFRLPSNDEKNACEWTTQHSPDFVHQQVSTSTEA